MSRLAIRTTILLGLLLAAALTGAEPDPRPVAHADNAFAYKLLNELGKQEGDLFFSPYSIHAALSMTWAGAKGQTATEMATVLQLGAEADPALVAPQHGALAAILEKAEEGARLRIANALFGAKRYPFREDFLKLNKDHFGAGLELCDFAGQPEMARQRINTWVAGKTEDKIVDLLPKGSINSLVRLVLVNAIYFKADWAQQFDVRFTKEADFFPTAKDGARVKALGKVAMMNRRADLRYLDTEHLPVRPKGPPPVAHVVVLPYQGNETEMVLMVPKASTPEGLADLEGKLGFVLSNLDLARETKVVLSLPRFELRWGTESLKKALINLGMPTAFQQGQADFSGMSDIATGDGLCIADVLHQAYVKVDEEGTEAAAATAVIMKGRAMHVEPEPVVVKADHPFLFVVRHRATGAILFLGRITDPTQVAVPAPGADAGKE